MKRVLGVLFFVFVAWGSSFAQDRIIKMNGDEVSGVVHQITRHVVAYTLPSDSNQVYQLSIDSVFIVKYGDGSKKMIYEPSNSLTHHDTIEVIKEVLVNDTVFVEVETEKVYEPFESKIYYSRRYNKFYFQDTKINQRTILRLMRETGIEEFIDEADKISFHRRRSRLNNWLQITVLPNLIITGVISIFAESGTYLLIPLAQSMGHFVAHKYHKRTANKLTIRGVKAINIYLSEKPEFSQRILGYDY